MHPFFPDPPSGMLLVVDSYERPVGQPRSSERTGERSEKSYKRKAATATEEAVPIVIPGLKPCNVAEQLQRKDLDEYAKNSIELRFILARFCIPCRGLRIVGKVYERQINARKEITTATRLSLIFSVTVCLPRSTAVCRADS